MAQGSRVIGRYDLDDRKVRVRHCRVFGGRRSPKFLVSCLKPFLLYCFRGKSAYGL